MIVSAENKELDKRSPEYSFWSLFRYLTVILVCAFTIFMVLSAIADWVGKPSSGAVRLDVFQNWAASESSVLPISRVTSIAANTQSITGTILLDLDGELSNPALLVPNYDGSLTLWLDGMLIKQPTQFEALGSSVVRLLSFVVAIDHDVLKKAQTLSFMIHDQSDFNTASFLSLSEIYIGEHDDFLSVVHRKKIFEEVFRPAVIFNLGITIIVLFGLMLSGMLGWEIAPLLAVILFMIFISLGGLVFIWPEISLAHRYAYFFSPLGVAAMNAYVSNHVYQGIQLRDRLIICLAVIVTALGLANYLLDVIHLTTTAYNVIVSVPILLIGMSAVAIRAAFMARKRTVFELAIISTILFVWLFSFTHDALGRLGVIDISVPVTNISMLLLFFTLGYIFAYKVIEARNAMAVVNAKMRLALKEQSRQLEAEFVSASKLRERDIVARNYERIYNDLHDGVLTYLFSIKTMGASLVGKEAGKVSTLAQFCLNEIRVILSSGVTGKTPLILTLSNLRHNIFDSLPDIGVQANWDTTALLDLPPTDLRFNIEIVRVLQEAVHNAVERADCSSLSVVATLRKDKMICFKIVNEGGVTFHEGTKKGFGLKSMSSRIQRLRGHFAIIPATGGAELTFEIPMPTAD